MIWYLTIGVIYVMVVAFGQRNELMEWENEIFKYLGDNKLAYSISVGVMYALYTTVGLVLWPVSIIYDVYEILKRAVR